MMVVTAFLAVAATSVSWATFEYMVVSIQTEMGLSVDVINAIARVAEGASLLVVFVAGSLGDRLGRRRIIIAGASAFCLGAVLVAVAPGAVELAVGRAVGGVGGTLMTVTAVAVVKETFVDERQRSKVFGLYAALTPAVFIVTPPLGAKMTETLGWRSVPLLWLALGAATLALTVWAVPRAPGSGERGELATPLLAGAVLSSVALGIAAGTHGVGAAVGPLAVALVALAVLIVLMRRLRHPSLDLRLLRDRRVWPVAVAVFLATGANLASYGALYLQYRYPESLVESALLLVIPQAAAVAGSLLGGQLAARWGATVTATALLLCASVASLGCLLIGAESPRWAVVAVLAVAAVPLGAAVGPLTQAFMDLAPGDGAGAASSIRNAISNLRGTITGVVSGAIIFSAFQSSMAGGLVDAGVAADAADRIASQLRSGAALSDIVAGPLVTTDAVKDLLVGPSTALHAAQAHALGVAGLITAAAYCGAAVAMGFALRSRAKGRVGEGAIR